MIKGFRLMNDIESFNGHRADIPEFLAELSNVVQMLNQLRTGTPSHSEVDNSLTKHTNMLAMFREITYQEIKFIEDTRMEGEALTTFIQSLLGKESAVSDYVEKLTQNCPFTERSFRIIEALNQQIQKLESLRRELWLEDKIEEVTSREVEILRKLPILFPESAPFRQTLKKRIGLLK